MKGDREHILGQPWPEFLNHLDTDPARVWRELFSLISRLMNVMNSQHVWSLSADERRDLSHDMIIHCCQADFQVLRTYENRGRPFSVWLSYVLVNKTKDFHRAKRRESRVEDSTDERQVGPSPVAGTVIPTKILTGCIRSLSSSCRILILLAAEGYQPIEIGPLLDPPETNNKKLGDKLRHCRKALARCLEKNGVDLSNVLPRYALKVGRRGQA